jgi:hypothetical protein
MAWIKLNSIAMILRSLVIIIMVIAYFINIEPITKISGDIPNWTVIIAGFALGVGAISVLSLHLKNIIKRTPNAPYSLILIIGFVIMSVSGLLLGEIGLSPIYTWAYTYLFLPINNTIMTLLAFYIFTAAVRVFRIRNIEASLLLVSSFLVLLGNMPMSSSIWVGFEPIRFWIMNIINAAAYRGIVIGTGIGLLIMGIRFILGIEKGAVGMKGE